MGYGESVQQGLVPPEPKLLIRSPHEVIAELANEGEPIPLGWPPLDRQMRGGGARAGRIIVLGGAPSAGKTTVLCQIALHLALSHPVYTLFSDEGDEGAATRFGVQLGVSLEKIESDRTTAAQEMADQEAERSLYMVTPDRLDSTPEKIVEYIIRTHEANGTLRAALFLDSIQTIAKLFAAKRDDSPRLAVERLMELARQWAIAHRMLILLSSRSNRASYRSKHTEANSEDMASFAESAAIEFGSDVALVFGLPNEDTGIGKVRIVKNRLKGTMGSFCHKYDDATGRMLEVDAPAADEYRNQQREQAHQKTVEALMAEIEKIIRKKGRLTTRQLADAAGGKTANVIAALRALERVGTMDWIPGARGANLWGFPGQGA